MRAFLSSLVVVTLLAGCKGETSEKKKEDKSSNAKGPDDLDVESIIDEVKCTKKDERKGCSCLREFEAAKTFDGVPDDGQTTWYGRTYALGGSADGKKQFFFGQFKPGKGNVRVLFPENHDEETDAKNLLKAVSAGDKAPKDSEAAKFIKTAKPEGGYHDVVKTKGPSLKLDVDEGIAYLRADGDRLLVLEYGEGKITMGFKSQKLTARAFCSELWKVR